MYILISGDGIGAGKTTLAQSLLKLTSVRTLSLADGIRWELEREYPGYKWFDKSQENKNSIIKETGKTLREMLIQRGQSRREIDPLYWCRVLQRREERKQSEQDNYDIDIAVDDIRYMNELEYFKNWDSLHIHAEYENAEKEPQYENDKLKLAADYVVRRGARFS